MPDCEERNIGARNDRVFDKRASILGGIFQ